MRAAPRRARLSVEPLGATAAGLRVQPAPFCAHDFYIGLVMAAFESIIELTAPVRAGLRAKDA
jgi:hypothetical protein